MSVRSRSFLILSLALLVLLALSVGVAAASRTVVAHRNFARSDDPSGVEPDYFDHSMMAPDGRMAFSFFDGAPGATAQARVYNPVTDTTTTVPATADDQLYPKLTGDWVVYQSEPPSGSDNTSTVHAYNLRTHVDKKISTNPNDYASDPQVSGNRAVWVQRGPSDYPTLYSANLANLAAAPTVLVPPTDFKGVPAGPISNFKLWGNWLAFDRFSGAESRYDVWLWDLSSSSNVPVKLTEGEVGRTLLRDLEGNRVAWYRENTPSTLDTVVIFDRMTEAKTEIENMTSIELLGTKAIVGNTSVGPDWFLYDFYLEELVSIAPEDGVFIAEGVSGWGDRFVAMSATAYNKNDLAYSTVLTPTVSATTPSTVVAQGARPRISGSVSELGTPIGHGKVRLEYSYNGVDFRADYPYVETNVGGSGTFAITVPEPVRGTIYYRAVYLGRVNEAADEYVEHLSAASRTVKLTAPVRLGRPVVPTTRARNKTWTAYGAITPGLDEGSRWLRVRAYKYERGKWRYKKYFVAREGMKNGAPAYLASVKLTSKGRWRLRAYWPTSADHPASYSSFSKTITVR